MTPPRPGKRPPQAPFTSRVLLLGFCGSLGLAQLHCASAPKSGETPASVSSPPLSARVPEQGSATAAPSPALDLPSTGDPVVDRMVRIAHTDSQVEAHAHHLTNVIGARLTSSHALMTAEQWARDQFVSWGMTARLEHWGDFPTGFDRGPAHARVLSPHPRTLDFVTPAWTPGVFSSGPVRLAKYPENAKQAQVMGERLKGAWLLFDGTRPRRRGRSLSAADQRMANALDQLDIGGIIYRDRDRGGELVHTFGNHRVSLSDLPKRPEIILRSDQHAELLAWLDAGKAVELDISIDNRFFAGPVPQHNVIAEIPGTEFPDQVVVVGGHLDSWDGATGAVDNATGVATTMEAARLLTASGATPRRTIQFVLWTGEEQGLFGSKAWVEANADALPGISVVLVHDGGTNYLSGLDATPEMAPQVTQATRAAAKLAAHAGYEFTIHESEQLNYGSSDHDSYLAKGVPGLFWHQTGRSEYRRMHHTQHDTFDAIIPEYQRHSALVVAASAWGFANLDGIVDRTNSMPISPRRMGVMLGGDHGTRIDMVTPDSKAAGAKWRQADVIVRMHGRAVNSRREIVQALRNGPPTVEVELRRGNRTIKSTLDYSQDPSEVERKRRHEARAQSKHGKQGKPPTPSEGNPNGH